MAFNCRRARVQPLSRPSVSGVGGCRPPRLSMAARIHDTKRLSPCPTFSCKPLKPQGCQMRPSRSSLKPRCTQGRSLRSAGARPTMDACASNWWMAAQGRTQGRRCRIGLL
eukprot:4659479-Alexandrium_andersonii.AAC.1